MKDTNTPKHLHSRSYRIVPNCLMPFHIAFPRAPRVPRVPRIPCRLIAPELAGLGPG